LFKNTKSKKERKTTEITKLRVKKDIEWIVAKRWIRRDHNVFVSVHKCYRATKIGKKFIDRDGVE
jgi:hypothetical protein